jgi:hypothetical protein
MKGFARLAASFAALLLTVAATRSADAADQKAALDKIKAKNQAAQSAFGASDWDEMKGQLMEAVAIGNESGLAKAKIMAQTYVLLGVLQVDGFKDNEAGIKFFAKALDINPAVTIPSNMSTKAVKAAFKRAEDEDTGSEEAEAEAPPPKPAKEKPGKSKKDERDRDEEAEQERQVSAALAQAAAEKKKDAADAAERKRQAESDRKERDADRKERDKLTEELAAAKVGESTQAAERDRLVKDKQDRDRQLGDTKGQLQQSQRAKADVDKQLAASQTKVAQLEKAKADGDRALADAKGQLAQLGKAKADADKAKADVDKQLAATQQSEKNERAAKEKAQAERADRDKQLADVRGQLQQLQKAKADVDKQLAATQQNEKNERAAKEKAQGTLQEVATREKERKKSEEDEKVERTKLEEGPDLPGHLSEPITCTIPDEVTANTDLYVHCVPQPGVGAKVVALYYRPAGSVLYNAAIMERTKKGWYTAMIPGSKIYGRLLHYYVEARDAKEKVAASNGKSSSPNIATVRSGGGGMKRAKAH